MIFPMLDAMVVGPMAFVIVTLQQFHLIYCGWELQPAGKHLLLVRKPYAGFLDSILIPLSVLAGIMR